jgi:hypothetical protein
MAKPPELAGLPDEPENVIFYTIDGGDWLQTIDKRVDGVTSTTVRRAGNRPVVEGDATWWEWAAANHFAVLEFVCTQHRDVALLRVTVSVDKPWNETRVDWWETDRQEKRSGVETPGSLHRASDGKWYEWNPDPKRTGEMWTRRWFGHTGCTTNPQVNDDEFHPMVMRVMHKLHKAGLPVTVPMTVDEFLEFIRQERRSSLQ